MLIKDIPLRSEEEFTSVVEKELQKRLGHRFHKVNAPTFRYDPKTGEVNTIFNSMVAGGGSFSETGIVHARGFEHGEIDYDVIHREVGNGHLYFYNAEEIVYSQFSDGFGKKNPVLFYVEDRKNPSTMKTEPGHVQIGHKVRYAAIKIGK